MRFTYLLIDIFSVIVPFIFSFHPRLRFYKQWIAFFPAMLITGITFIAWDMYFTRLKIWGFNAAYLTGINVGNLPIEEILFFLCIPYSCVFTYACFKLIIKKAMSRRSQLITSSLLIIASVFMAVSFYNQAYTCAAFAVLAVLIFIVQYLLKARWLSKFYITYLFLLMPFLIVNGLLTGTGLNAPIVWYNAAHIVNIRILSIPVEDVFYGMDLVLLNITIYALLSARIYRRLKNRRKAAVYANHLTYSNHNITS